MPHCCRVRAVCDACLQRSQQPVQQPLPSLSQLLPQLPVQPPPSTGSTRAFQLRNDSGVLVQPNHPRQFSRHFSHSVQVRLIVRDDQGGSGEGFCHVDTLLAPRIVFPAVRRG